MEAEKNRGGARKGAGRRKVSDPKELVPLYMERSFILKNGGRFALADRLREIVLADFVMNPVLERAEEPKKEPAPEPMFKPIAATPQQHFSHNVTPQQAQQNFSNTVQLLTNKILSTTNYEQLSKVVSEINREPLVPRDKIKLTNLADQHRKDKGMYTD